MRVERVPHLVYLETFGCQMNQLDSELLVERFLQHGYEMTEEIDRAGVIVYNTCSVRAHAEDKVYSNLGRLKFAKRACEELVIAVVGCMAQLQKEQIHRRMPHVDIILGTGEFTRLPELVEQARRTQSLISGFDLKDVRISRGGGYLRNRHSAYVSIIRGCDMPCTYCVVPTTRGKQVSRYPREILAEVEFLRDQGVKEITLLGQTVDAYGRDIDKRLTLAKLLELLDRVEGIERIRFVTSHPSFITVDLMDAVAGLSKVCEYIHMPAQSGSDRILRRMRRGYNRRIYLEKVEMLRERIPEVAIASDFIVGYPGEGEEDFQLSVDLIEEVGFQNSFIFKYSPRPGTKAWGVEENVSLEEKKRRNQILLEVQGRVSLRWKQAQLGRVVEILVEGYSKSNPSRLSGRTRGNDIVVFDFEGFCADSLIGKLVSVELKSANSYTFIGELIHQPLEI
ncbi:MAG: tRNA (N6-isopentenyl adenosine(37)-C2)-methylthiotransferase MiaB [Planctomycetota bacterium]|nr:MAG: tRNA (N6-isopentenyl adenosine(37)-C2)-methylthiotransferase MiaB [Planctomycetota bacterium]